MTAPADEFTDYLAKRKRRWQMILGGLVVLFVAIVAVPYTLMELDVLEKSTFEVFVFADVVVLIGCIRAAVTSFKDSAL